LFLRDSTTTTHDLEERLLRGALDDEELNAHLSTEQGKSRVLEILSRTETGRRRAEELFGASVWDGVDRAETRDRPAPGAASTSRQDDPIGIGVGGDAGDDSMFVDLVNQDEDEDAGKEQKKKADATAAPAAGAEATPADATPATTADPAAVKESTTPTAPQPAAEKASENSASAADAVATAPVASTDSEKTPAPAVPPTEATTTAAADSAKTEAESQQLNAENGRRESPAKETSEAAAAADASKDA
jgi:hypothetical protein